MPKKKKNKKNQTKQIKQAKQKNYNTLIIFLICLIIVLSLLYINKPKEKSQEETIQTPSNKIKTQQEILIPVNSTYQLDIQKEDPNSPLTYILEDTNYVTIDTSGLITAKRSGKTTLTIKSISDEIEIEITTTDLLISRNEEYNYDKTSVAKREFTKEENEFLDDLLKQQINQKGYHTRAAAVEAARFLTIDFAYSIPYFYENGRMSYGVDGQGRYYHEGLYLCNEKINELKYKSKNTAPWGQIIYSRPAKSSHPNGLDCSGFVTWALYNAGYDVGDIGSGITGDFDLTDIGTNLKNIKNNLNKIKVGDLLHSNEAGGHIGIIVGIDKNYIYFAQAIWYHGSTVQVTKIDKNNIPKYYDRAILLDDFYGEDGDLTDMWY